MDWSLLTDWTFWAIFVVIIAPFVYVIYRQRKR